MDLAAYFRRIGFTGDARPDRATLDAVHRRHALSIPYENLDVQLGIERGVDPHAAFEKIVTGGRGGWCYEMNGVLGLALQEIGFKVTRLAGGVMRQPGAEGGNHLVLRVDLPEGPVIADVGFGDGPILPFDLREGPFRSGHFDFSLARVDDGYWRLNNHPRGGAPYFDFLMDPADEAVLARTCVFLRTNEASPFVQSLVAQIYTEAGVTLLRGRVLRFVGPDRDEQRLLNSADELVAVLKREFGLDAPEAAGLWDRVVKRHEAVFGSEATAGTSGE